TQPPFASTRDIIGAMSDAVTLMIK
ncbi:hypothetical protein A2U01_0059923, partial [Trifolium medium]|nr:hypothetical protein [Trifolium medium]